MKVVQKIVAASVCWTSLVLILESYQRLQRELTLLEGDLIKECRLVSSLVERDLVHMWRAQGGARLADHLADLNDRIEPIEVRAVDFSAPRKDARRPVFSASDVERSIALEEPLRDESTAPARLVTYTWLPEVGEGKALELSVSLEQEEQFIERAIFDLCVMLLLIILIAVAFSSWAGWFVIGKRIHDMIALTRDAAQGIHRHLEVSRLDDEISELMRALDAMSTDLEQSNADVSDERARREALTTQLLHTDRLATTGVLLSQVAHEIGTPLAVIRGRLQRAMKLVSEEHLAQRELLIAVEQVDRVKHIIRNMLDFSRGQSDVSSCAMSEMPARAIALVEMLATHHRVRFALNVLEEGQFRGDRLAMEQAFINVLLNALHVSSPGDVITVTQSRVHDEFSRDMTRVTVLDQGPGISAALASRIFEPFFTTKVVGEGTGMGLMIASTIVKAHQGSLTLDETCQDGARFVFELPHTPEDHHDETPQVNP